MPKRKKIYYVSGMISLIFIPLLFWCYGSATLKSMEVRVLDFGLRAKEKEGKPVPEYYRIAMEDWTYKPVNVQPNFGKKEEQNFENLIRKMVSENISKTGIQFKFTDQNTYGDLVKILNLMLKTNQEVYGLDIDDTNSFYLLHKQPLPQQDIFRCGTRDAMSYMNQAEYDYKHASFRTKIVNYSSKEIYLLISGFLILVIVSSLSFRSK